MAEDRGARARPHELSRRALVHATAVFGLLGLACRGRDAPDTEVPTAQLGPHFRKLRKRIRKHVPKGHRRAGALALVEQIDARLGEVDRLLVDWRTDIALLPDGAGRIAMLTVTRNYSEQLGELAREVGRLAFDFRCFITADEWPRVFPAPEREQEHDGPC